MRHTLPVILAVAITAVLAGACSFAAIGEWVADQSQDTLAGLGADRADRPWESAIRRLLTRLDADLLDSVIGAWMWTRTGVVHGRRVIALDGKTVRGARTNERTAPHLVASFDHGAGAVLGQVAVAAKSNEIPAARTLLASLDLHDAVVTLDAMHTQTDTAKAVLDAGAAYVLTVKSNQCATRRADTFSPQAGQTRREVCWVRCLTWIRKVKGARAWQKTGGRVLVPGTACRGT